MLPVLNNDFTIESDERRFRNLTTREHIAYRNRRVYGRVNDSPRYRRFDYICVFLTSPPTQRRTIVVRKRGTGVAKWK